MTAYVCRDCRESMSQEATTCPHCGATGDEGSGAVAGFQFLIGGVLTMTILGAIVGIPLMWSAIRKGKRANNASPAVRA